MKARKRENGLKRSSTAARRIAAIVRNTTPSLAVKKKRLLEVFTVECHKPPVVNTARSAEITKIKHISYEDAPKRGRIDSEPKVLAVEECLPTLGVDGPVGVGPLESRRLVENRTPGTKGNTGVEPGPTRAKTRQPNSNTVGHTGTPTERNLERDKVGNEIYVAVGCTTTSSERTRIERVGGGIEGTNQGKGIVPTKREVGENTPDSGRRVEAKLRDGFGELRVGV